MNVISKKPTRRAKKWLEPEGLILITGWAQLGLNNEQIANNMGIHPSTLYDWSNNYSDISEALKKGKEVVDLEIMNVLYETAKSGNTTAIIFWLKNRMPEHFKDRVEYTDTKSLKKLDKVLDSLGKQANETD